MYGRFPYVVMDQKMVSASEETLFQQLRLIDAKNGFRLLRHSIEKVMAVCESLDLDRQDLILWANPLCDMDEKALRQMVHQK
ncbi:hypothetical protein AB6A23_22335 [Paenibacillus tarimensis]